VNKPAGPPPIIIMSAVSNQVIYYIRILWQI
jgi:hypothetical protein